jgi:hypothetical protein
MGVYSGSTRKRTRIKLAFPKEFHDQIEGLEHDVRWVEKKKAVVIVTPKAIIEFTPPSNCRCKSGESPGETGSSPDDGSPPT